MLFNLILVILIGAVAFFHYIQGMFSATISAIVVVIAAVLAVAYHEWLATYLIARFPDSAAAISVIAVFALVYIVIRLGIDAMVPGNVRLPVIMDKIGAGVMGVFVGLIVTGIISIATQTLAFGPDLAGYTRFKVGTVEGHYLRNGQWHNEDMNDLMDKDSLDPAANDLQTLWFHQDDLVLGLTKMLSNGGALSNDKPLDSIHPDYLTELFGQRLGIQVGANHTLVSTDAQGYVKVDGVYTQKDLTQLNGELARIRHPELGDNGVSTDVGKKLRDLDPFKEDTDKKLLIVRVVLTGAKSISDTDSLLRYSPGAIRLLVPEPGTPNPYKDYYPIATLDPKGIALTHRIDDFLFTPTDKPHTIDFIFMVDDAALKSTGKDKFGLYDGAFLEFKRNARVDLSNKRVILGPPLNQDVDADGIGQGIELKDDVKKALKAMHTQTLQQPETVTDEKK